jgi:hypothetical protein
MKIKQVTIGALDQPSGGIDCYFLLTRADGPLTPDEAIEWVRPQVYVGRATDGSYHCKAMNAVQVPKTDNKVILIIEHRYEP